MCVCVFLCAYPVGVYLCWCCCRAEQNQDLSGGLGGASSSRGMGEYSSVHVVWFPVCACVLFSMSIMVVVVVVVVATDCSSPTSS